MALNKQDQLHFADQLLTLLESGLPLLNAIALIYSTAPKPWLLWISGIHTQLKKGRGLFSMPAQPTKSIFYGVY